MFIARNLKQFSKLRLVKTCFRIRALVQALRQRFFETLLFVSLSLQSLDCSAVISNKLLKCSLCERTRKRVQNKKTTHKAVVSHSINATVVALPLIIFETHTFSFSTFHFSFFFDSPFLFYF